MRPIRSLSLLLALSAACGGTAEIALDKPTIDTLPGGVVRVTNAGPSAWADTSGWTLDEEFVLSPAEGSPGELTDVGSVTADSAGNIYVFQNRPAQIRMYTAAGEWVRDIGREGGGPGEYRNGMFGIHRDTLFVQDPNNTRLTTFRTSGEFIASHRSQCCWWTSNFPIFADGTVGIMGPPPANASDRQGAIYVTRLDGVVVDTVLLPARTGDGNDGWVVRRTQGKSTSMMTVDVPMQPTDQSAFLPDHRRVRGSTAVYTLAITTLDGDTVRLFSAPAPVHTITEAQRDSIYEAEMENIDADWRDAFREVAKKSDIPTTAPAWSRVMVDGRGRIWVGRPGPRGETSVLDVFNADGVLLGSVVPPAKFEMRGTWVGDRLYQRAESEEGLPQVKVYRVNARVRTEAEDSR